MSFSGRGLKRKAVDAPMLSPSSKKRLTNAEKALVAAEMEIAQAIVPRNFPIRSGAPSGLFNLATQTKENKFVDTNIGDGFALGTTSSVPLSSGPTILLLNGLKLGTAAYNRIGNKIAMRSLYWSVNYGVKVVDADPTVDVENVNVPVRMMIVYDKQANGVTFGLGDLLSAFVGVDNTTARAIDTNSPNNLNNRDRFIVLADKRFILGSGGPSFRHIKKFKRLNTSVAYKSGATVGDVTDITSGALYFVTYRDQDLDTTGGDNTFRVNITGDIRMRYSDD